MAACNKASVNLIIQLCKYYLLHLIHMIEEVHMLCSKIKKVLFGQGALGEKTNSNIFFFFFISFNYGDAVMLHPGLRALRDGCLISCSFPGRAKCLRSRVQCIPICKEGKSKVKDIFGVTGECMRKEVPL